MNRISGNIYITATMIIDEFVWKSQRSQCHIDGTYLIFSMDYNLPVEL